MNVTVRNARPETAQQSQLGFVDCDVHPFIKSGAEFDPFLSERWKQHRRTIGGRSRAGIARTAAYPRMSPGVGMRMDSWNVAGDHPGSDLDLMREQLLDLFGVAYGLMPAAGGRRRVGAQHRLRRSDGHGGERVAGGFVVRP